MPRSKRARVIPTSKVTKKGKELTRKVFQTVQECCSQYDYIYVFSVENMRNTYLKDVRQQLPDSRLLIGKTKVIAKALGSDASDAPEPGTQLLSPFVAGEVGLLFSPRPLKEVQTFLDSYRPMDFARSGTLASRDFTLPAGTVYASGGELAHEDDTLLVHTLEPVLRKLGVPSRLVKGRVEIDSPYVVCKEGDTLTSAQTTLLKMFGIQSAEFSIALRAMWEKESGKVTDLTGGDGVMDVE